MASLRLTLMDLLARLLQRWANALTERLESARPVAVEPVPPADGRIMPPPDWLEAATPTPPQHWLDLVREHAPQLLDAEGRDVIDWSAEDIDLYSPPPAEAPAMHVEWDERPPSGSRRGSAARAQPLRRRGASPSGRGEQNDGAEVVWDERPLAPPTRPHTTRTAAGRALPLVEVSTSLPAVRQPVKNVVSKLGRAAKLHFAGSPHPQPFSLRARGVNQADWRGPTPHLDTAHQNKSFVVGHNREKPLVKSAFSPQSGSPLPEGEGLGVRAARGVRAIPTRSRRFFLRNVRSTLAKPTAPPDVHSLRGAPPPLAPVHTTMPFTAPIAESRPRFPALLHDERETGGFDSREAERRQRLDAEQEGRPWNA